MKKNPRPPEKPLHLVVVNGFSGEFDVIGWLGNARVGYVTCTPLKKTERAARGQAVRVDLGDMPAWFIENAFLKDPKYQGKGYGTQLYAAAFAEAAKRSGGPVVVGSAEAIARSPHFRIGTSADAKAVWKRIIDEGIYPSHPTEQAIVFRPEDTESWMLPAKYFEWYQKERKR